MDGYSDKCSKWPWGRYTTALPFFGSEINGPAHACQSSIHTDATAGVVDDVKSELPDAADDDAGESNDTGAVVSSPASSLSTVFRSISPHIIFKP